MLTCSKSTKSRQIGRPLVYKLYGKTHHKEEVIIPFSMNELKMALDAVNIKSATGEDEIGYSLVKEAEEKFHQKLLLLYNEL